MFKQLSRSVIKSIYILLKHRKFDTFCWKAPYPDWDFSSNCTHVQLHICFECSHSLYLYARFLDSHNKDFYTILQNCSKKSKLYVLQATCIFSLGEKSRYVYIKQNLDWTLNSCYKGGPHMSFQVVNTGGSGNLADLCGLPPSSALQQPKFFCLTP